MTMETVFAHETSRRLFDYWNEMRGDRRAPTRRAIDPAEIRSLLPSLFILEASTGGVLAFRLAGTGVCTLFGLELRGGPLSGLWIDGGARSALAAAAGAMHDLQPAVVRLAGESRSGRSLALEMCLLPLTANEEGERQILGIMAPLDAPHWLHADPLVGVVTEAVRLVDVAAETNRPRRSDARMFQPIPGRGRPDYLRLVEGGLQRS
ncbi:MAG: PAS domain-containing protein [Pararhizobium sp.]